MFHTAAWARVLSESYGYRPSYACIGAGGLMPMMAVESSLTGRRGVALPFTDECAPLVSPVDASNLADLREFWCAEAQRRKWKYVEFRGETGRNPATAASTRFYGHALALSGDEDRLFAHFSSATRRGIRKAENSSLTVDLGHSLPQLRTFYGLIAKTRKRHGVPPQPFFFYRKIRQHLLEPKKGLLVLVRHASRTIAGALFLHHADHAIFKFGGSDVTFQHLRPNNLAIWKGIQWYAQNGFRTLDFGRTSLDNEGLRGFKLGWGAQERVISYDRYDCTLKRFVEVRDRSSGYHSTFFRNLPTPVSRCLGVLLYRHMG